MTPRIHWTTAMFGAFTVLASIGGEAGAHSGPPYPIVSDRVAGPYRISIWTDPDATDDGSPGGQFWVVVDPSGGGGSLPSDTRVSVSIGPLDRPGEVRTSRAAPDNGDLSRQFVALVMAHEGPFAVRVAIAGSMGNAQIDAEVQATYDLRPPPITMALYLMPFVLVGALWLKLLRRRRRESTRGGRMIHSKSEEGG